MTSTASWLRRLAAVLLLLCLAVSAVTVRAILEGRAELELSNVAFHQGDVPKATLHARRAATWYAPGAGHVGAAYERLLAIAKGSEAAGDMAGALYAWRSVRAACLETRHLRPVRPELLEQANGNVARLQVLAEASVTAAETRERQQQLLADLRQAHAPPPALALLLGIGLAALLLGLSGFLRFGMDAEGRLRLPAALVSLAITLIGAVCWTIAAIQA